jgi:WhiB family transcriptional regulator, redox-sensing transcriptional regulator
MTQKYEWRDEALCIGLETSLFYPDFRGKSIGIQTYIDENLPCKRCPVKSECIDFADENEEEFGIWGGKYRSPRLVKHGQ